MCTKSLTEVALADFTLKQICPGEKQQIGVMPKVQGFLKSTVLLKMMPF
jgi:hypothetical protein